MEVPGKDISHENPKSITHLLCGCASHGSPINLTCISSLEAKPQTHHLYTALRRPSV